MRLFFFISFLLSVHAAVSQPQRSIRQSNWQQHVDYTIEVALNDSDNTLTAFESISYTNNSPVALTELYFHLWPNAYRNDETLFARQLLENGDTKFHFAREEDRGGIGGLSFKVNGAPVNWRLNDSIDICRIELATVLQPGQTIAITTPFKVKLPAVFSRAGHEDGAYNITQWYPKPAVFDVNGWNMMPYLDQGEFYSEFGNYQVKITVPTGYKVAATGQASGAASENFYGITQTYVQDSVHDFAWFCSKTFQVTSSEVTLPRSGRKVSTHLYSGKGDNNAVRWIDSAVLFYSRMVGEYPYAAATVVVTPLSAGGGMEYPMITNVTKADRQTIVHEVGHNWFYGILGSNERLYPWMDESINSYYEARSTDTDQPASHKGFRFSGSPEMSTMLGESPFGFSQIMYLLSARRNEDQPLGLPSTEYTKFNYGSVVYGKGAVYFRYLQDCLGDSLFDAMMRAYYDKWKFRHPLPGDFIDHAKIFTGKDLKWFEEGMMTGVKQDYAIVRAGKGQVTIKNKSSWAAPFSVTSLQGEIPVSTGHFEGFTGKRTFDFDLTGADKVRIDAYERTLDAYRKNNTMRTSGLLKKWEPLSIRLAGSTEDPYRSQLFFVPAYGYNMYNRSMPGLVLYNSILPERKLDYVLTPLYSFHTNDLNGYAKIQRHFYAGGWLRRFTAGVQGARFAHENYGLRESYNKVAPFLLFEPAGVNARSLLKHQLMIRNVTVLHTTAAGTRSRPEANISEVAYSIEKKDALNPGMMRVVVQRIDDRTAAIKAFAEVRQSIAYDRPKKKLDMRLFLGSFLDHPSRTPGIGEYQFKMSGNTGLFDYTYDQALIGRSEQFNGLFSHQVLDREGYLKMPVALTSSDSWIIAANLVSTVPGPIPVRVFADGGYINSTSTLFSGGTVTVTRTPVFQYAAGIKVVVAEGIFEVNFPLFVSSDFTALEDKNAGNFEILAQRITFVLSLNRLNPLEAARTARF